MEPSDHSPGPKTGLSKVETHISHLRYVHHIRILGPNKLVFFPNHRNIWVFDTKELLLIIL